MIQDKFIGQWAFPLDDSLLEQSARRGEQYDFKKIADDIVSKMQFTSSDVVLDLCCGNAALARYVASVCKEVHGVDHSEKLLASARELKKKDGIANLHLHVSDALKIDLLFPENHFDKSYCYFSFQYFNKNNRQLLLEKLSRVTKQNGIIFLGDVPDKNRRWNFYSSPWQFYREKLSRMVQMKEGECGLGWWVVPNEILEWCEKNKLSATILPQDKTLPHAHYRFDVMIRNSK